MSWQYLGLYVAMFVTSPPFIVGGGLFFALGVLLGRVTGARRRRR